MVLDYFLRARYSLHKETWNRLISFCSIVLEEKICAGYFAPLISSVLDFFGLSYKSKPRIKERLLLSLFFLFFIDKQGLSLLFFLSRFGFQQQQ